MIDVIIFIASTALAYRAFFYGKGELS